MFSDNIQQFLISLKDRSIPDVPSGFEVLNPYTNPEVQQVVTQMCQTYYSGTSVRCAMWGINPGRFGSGVTGLSFTDPWGVREYLGINTTLQGKNELSAEFVRMVIDAMGGPTAFYQRIYLSAMSPLGFVKNGININFYDDAEFSKRIVPFVLECMKEQHAAGLESLRCIVMGTGKLKQFFEKHIQQQLGYRHVTFLEHPRFIMQYKRKALGQYIKKYVDAIEGDSVHSN